MNKDTKVKVRQALDTLSKTDTYSLMMFTLYKLKDDPKCASLCELSYILDNENLIKLLSYYGGMTIRIPTLREMRLVLQALLIYEYVNLNGGSYDDAIRSMDKTEFTPNEIKETYQAILDVTANYEFKRD